MNSIQKFAISLILLIALGSAGWWIYSDVQSTRSALEVMHENVLRKKNDLANEQKSRQEFKDKLAIYREDLGRFKEAPDLVQLGAVAAKKVAEVEAKGFVASAIDFYKDYKNQSKQQKVDTAVTITDRVLNSATGFLADKAEDKVIKRIEDYVNSAFSNALKEYNDSAQTYNSVITTARFTTWYYGIEREPYLGDDGSSNALTIRNQ